MLHNRFIAAMDDDLDTPTALLLLREAAEKVTTTHNSNTGAEVLRLAGVLGLCV